MQKKFWLSTIELWQNQDTGSSTNNFFIFFIKFLVYYYYMGEITMQESKFKFIHISTDSYGNTRSKVLIETYDNQLVYIVESFKNFLQGCGFNMDGMDIQIVDKGEL